MFELKAEIRSLELDKVESFDDESWNGLCPKCESEISVVDRGFVIGTFNKRDIANTLKTITPIFMTVYKCKNCDTTIWREGN